jgi:hypothetical protein
MQAAASASATYDVGTLLLLCQQGHSRTEATASATKLTAVSEYLVGDVCVTMQVAGGGGERGAGQGGSGPCAQGCSAEVISWAHCGTSMPNAGDFLGMLPCSRTTDANSPRSC